MWKENINALKLYFNEAVKEWTLRGYKNNMKLETIRGKIVFLKWFKNKKHYSKFN